MAGNNSLNSNFPGGLTATGTTLINSTGSAATTIGTTGIAVTLASNATSSITYNANNFVINTDTLNIGTDSTSKIISMGSSSMTTATLGPTFGFYSNVAGSIVLRSATGKNVSIINNGGNISFDVTTSGQLVGVNFTGSNTVNIGTAAGNIPMKFGNTASTTTLTIHSGTGGINIGTSNAKTINIGNTTGATSVVLNNILGSVLYPFINITGITASLIPGVLHVINSGASLCTVTLPTTCAIGSIITVAGFGSGGWIIAQNSGQSIKSTASSTTTGVVGTIASGGRYDCIQIQCITADTTWAIKSSKGTLIFV